MYPVKVYVRWSVVRVFNTNKIFRDTCLQWPLIYSSTQSKMYIIYTRIERKTHIIAKFSLIYHIQITAVSNL